MKKLVAVVFVLLASAACGGVTNSVGTQPGLSNQRGAAQSGGSAQTGPAIIAVPGSTSVAPNTDVTPVLQGPQVIRQADISVTVSANSFDSKLTQLRTLVEQEQGFISGTDAQQNPLVPNDQLRSGVVTFMVPAANFDQTIDQVGQLGKIQSERISGADVSAQYVDLQARLANEEALRDAMAALLSKAQTVSDIIAVQTQLGEITQQIEELKGQIAYLDHNTAYSTITVEITEAGAPAPTTSTDSWGLVSALSSAAHNFVTTIDYLLSGLGAVAPVVVLAGLGYFLWRRRRTLPAAHAA